MSAYPYMVELAWDVINKFIRDWQNNPYYWDRERDVQVELASRLRLAYQVIGSDVVEGKYIDLPGFDDIKKWSRVGCEPKIHYVYEDKRNFCFPDIVVWDDIEDPKSPPPPGKWPIILLCEIKYKDKEEKDSWDLEKMDYLIYQHNYAQYGCWLELLRKRADKGNGVVWDRKKDLRLWHCQAKLPALE